MHFLPDAMQRKVWDYFDEAETHYGTPWPVTYRDDEETRLATLRSLGLRAIPALVYPHKPGMAQWLNAWCADFARTVPDAVHCATFYPERGVGDVVAAALDDGARLFKMHVQVGDFTPDDERLDPAWARLERARVPVVIHAGSAPIRGTHTGPDAVRQVLRRHPDLVLVVAHLGMPEYHEFADLADEFAGVHLDTTMSGTDFTNRFAPFPDGYVKRLATCATGSCSDRTSRASPIPMPTSSTPSPASASATGGCERCCGTTAPDSWAWTVAWTVAWTLVWTWPRQQPRARVTGRRRPDADRSPAGLSASGP